MAKPVGRILVTNDDGIDAPGLVSAVKIAKRCPMMCGCLHRQKK